MKMNGVYNYCVQSVNSVYANLQPIDTSFQKQQMESGAVK